MSKKKKYTIKQKALTEDEINEKKENLNKESKETRYERVKNEGNRFSPKTIQTAKDKQQNRNSKMNFKAIRQVIDDSISQ